MPVGAVGDEVLGCEQVIGVELEHPPLALSPFRRGLAADHTMVPTPAASIGMPERLRTLGPSFQPARGVSVESASGAGC